MKQRRSSTRSQRTPRILWAAGPLLILVPRLRATRAVSDLGALREQTAQMLRDMQARLRADEVDARRVAQAASVIAALVDHVVTSMPWGIDAAWRSLASLAGDSTARTPSQRILDVTRAAPADAQMRELITVALSLGFDERMPADDVAIAQVRAELIEVDAAATAPAFDALSGRWSSAVQRSSVLSGWLPLWVSSVAVAALLSALFFGLRVSLGAQSNQLSARLSALNAPVQSAARPLPAAEPRLGRMLSPAIAERQLVVRDEIDRSIVVIPDGQLFAAGGATLRPEATPLLRSIAAALEVYPGRVMIIGHTDGTLVPSARYPSEWELSVDRAGAVSDALQKLGVVASRLAFDGRANLETASRDDSVAGSAGNGRIEIRLLAGR